MLKPLARAEGGGGEGAGERGVGKDVELQTLDGVVVVEASRRR